MAKYGRADLRNVADKKLRARLRKLFGSKSAQERNDLDPDAMVEELSRQTDITPKSATVQIKGVSAAGAVGTLKTQRVEQTYDANGLGIILQFGGEPTAETYEFLQDYFSFRLEQLKKKPKAKGKPSDDEAA